MNNSLKYVRYKFHWITDIRISFQSCDDKRDIEKHRGWKQWVKNNEALKAFSVFFHDYEHEGKYSFSQKKNTEKKWLQEKHIFFMLSRFLVDVKKIFEKSFFKKKKQKYYGRT